MVQKYLHDMTGWDSLSVEAQERIIGRKKLSDVELAEGVKPSSSHSSLTTIEKDGQEVKILRHNMAFGRPGRENSAPTLSAMQVRPSRSSRCWRTCLSDAHPATTTGFSITAARSLEAYFCAIGFHA